MTTTTARAPIERAIARAIAAPPARRAAVDLGNGSVNAVADDRVTTHPSLSADRGVETWAGAPRPGVHHLTIDGINVVVGDAALGYGSADPLMAGYDAAEMWRRYTEPRARWHLLAALVSLYPDHPDLVIDRLTTGAPAALVKQHGAAINAALVGAYTFAYQGRPRRIEIASVDVLAECRAAAVLLPADAPQEAIVHDVGNGTWQAMLVVNGQPKGVKTWAEGGAVLLDRAGVNGLPVARWRIVDAMRRDTKAHPAERAAFAKEAQGLIRAKDRELGGAMADVQHYVIGGYAPLIAPALAGLWGKTRVVVLGDETSNARAYWRSMEGMVARG